MKKLIQLALLCLLLFNIAEAQRAKIVNEAVTPHSLTTLGLPTNSVSTGLDVVGNQTYVYLSAKNIGNADEIQNAVFTLISKPSGSAASLTTFGTNWVYFQPDVKGDYTVSLQITTATGTHDTTKVITAADFIGVGTFDGVSGSFPKCSSCHSSDPKFSDIFNRWKVSGHANIFKSQITTGSAYYSTSCMKCHTTGYDHHSPAANGGFDDVAASLGWTWAGPPSADKWDHLKTNYPGLVNLATIGCESCHGPGSEHRLNIPNKIQISNESGVCAQCHDEPWRHNKYSEWENSLHSEALWSSSFAQAASGQNNNLQNCIRCHDAKGYVNFTKGLTTNTTGMVEGSHQKIGCSTCHDPHGNSNTASLRSTPAGSDTLGNGYKYTSIGGTGQTCMNCHKARRDNVSYVQTNVTSSHWGPHHSVQSDVLLGQNAADFGTPFLSSAHRFAVGDACVTCHMVATADTGTVHRDKVGGHTFKLHNDGYDHTAACTSCHGPKENFNNAFMAAADFDGDGTIESVREEIAGLETLLRIWLPPVGVDEISYSLIGASGNLNLRKAYWNYQLIAYDGSGGMHNPKYAIDVLTKSIMAIGGVVPVQMTSFAAEVNGNSVTLNWETATETNNKGFEVQRKTGSSFEKVAFVDGKGTTSEANMYSYTDKVTFNGVAVYRIKQMDFDGTSQYSKEIEVELNGPVDFQLTQNYPNPFNPSTKFSYNIPVDSKVKVLVYSIAGEMVAELVNTTQASGNYDLEFNSNNTKSSLSSGVYFYTIEAIALDGSRTFKESKKMVLLK